MGSSKVAALFLAIEAVLLDIVAIRIDIKKALMPFKGISALRLCFIFR